MEHASAEEFVEIEGAERTGLGTPATRAGVLEKLVRGGFLERKGRQLLSTCLLYTSEVLGTKLEKAKKKVPKKKKLRLQKELDPEKSKLRCV